METRVYTPGVLGLAHPLPNITIPAISQRPDSAWIVNGLPPSFCAPKMLNQGIRRTKYAATICAIKWTRTVQESFSPSFHPAHTCPEVMFIWSAWLHKLFLQIGSLVSIKTSLWGPRFCVAPHPVTKATWPGCKLAVGRQMGRTKSDDWIGVDSLKMAMSFSLLFRLKFECRRISSTVALTAPSLPCVRSWAPKRTVISSGFTLFVMEI